MTTISLRISEQDEKLIKEYAKANNISVSALFRESVLEKIEDSIDLNLYVEEIKAYKERPESISFDEMLEGLAE